jgi:hypothetical protein
MTRRKSYRSDHPVLLLWLLIFYLVYRVDPKVKQSLQGITESVGQYLEGISHH